jgi:nitrate/nitrite transport system permease protein
MMSLDLKAALLSLLLLGCARAPGSWRPRLAGVATVTGRGGQERGRELEYAKLMGKDGRRAEDQRASHARADGRGDGAPSADPFYDNGPNDKGIAMQLGSFAGSRRHRLLIAALIAVPLGFLIGMSPLIYRALDPFIQVLKPISPLAWMPLALYTIKDSSISGIFVIFICSIWPMLINTAFGVAGVRRDWLNVARTLEVRPLRRRCW